MSLNSSAVAYKELGAEIKALTEKRAIAKRDIINQMSETTTVTDDGTRITVFRKDIKDMPLHYFETILKDRGVTALYEICRVVQNRLSSEDKEKLTVVGKGATEIRVC